MCRLAHPTQPTYLPVDFAVLTECDEAVNSEPGRARQAERRTGQTGGRPNGTAVTTSGAVSTGAAAGRLGREADLAGLEVFPGVTRLFAGFFFAARERAVNDASAFFARRASLRAFLAALSSDLNAFFAAFSFDLAARAACLAALATVSARSSATCASATVLGLDFDFSRLRFIFTRPPCTRFITSITLRPRNPRAESPFTQYA